MVSKSSAEMYRDFREPLEADRKPKRGERSGRGLLLGEPGVIPYGADFQDFRTTQNDWGALASLYREAAGQYGDFLHNWMDEVGHRIVYGVLQSLSGVGNWTGTYANSFSYQIQTTGDGTPELAIGHLDPVGQNVDRLHIYWKVMETGAKPNPKLSGSARSARPGTLYEWSVAKTGKSLLGLKIAMANRIGSYGISARPVLSKYFVFAGEDLTVTGLTPLGKDIVMKARREAWDKFEKSVMNSYKTTFKREETFRRGGRFVSAFRDVLTGRFTTKG